MFNKNIVRKKLFNFFLKKIATGSAPISTEVREFIQIAA